MPDTVELALPVRSARAEMGRGAVLAQDGKDQGLGEGEVQPPEVAAELLGHILCHPQIAHQNIAGLFHRYPLLSKGGRGAVHCFVSCTKQAYPTPERLSINGEKHSWIVYTTEIIEPVSATDRTSGAPFP